MNNIKKWKGFTLVELIIVITILAILATIAFISYQGYTKNARDGNRLSNLNNIEKGLAIYNLKTSQYPEVEGNYITIYSTGGNILGYQGDLGENITRLINMNKIPLDPLDNNKFTYGINKDKNSYQVLTFLETPENIAFNFFPITQTYAFDYSTRYIKTIGNGLGILLGNTPNDINRPIQEKYDVNTFTGINIEDSNQNNLYKSIISQDKIFTGNTLIALKNTFKKGYNSSLVGYWDMETMYNSGGINYVKDLSGNGVDCSTNGVTSTGGIKGKALQTSSLVINSISCLNIIQTGSTFTLSINYKINTYLLGYYPISGISGGIFAFGTALSSFSHYVYNGMLSIVYPNGISSFTYGKSSTGGNSEEVGKWVNDILSYDNNVYKFYTNGKLIHSWTSHDIVNDTRLIFPKGWNTSITPSVALKGDISVDEVSIYNKVLNDDEIIKLSKSYQ